MAFEIDLNSLIIIITIFIFISMIKSFIYLSKKRKEMFKQEAMKYGYSYSEKFEIPDNKLDLLNWPRATTSNCVTANKSGKIFHLFEHTYTRSYGSKTRYIINVVLLSDLDVTDFKLEKEHFFHRLGDKFVKKDIDFENNPIFSKMYVLKGNDELKIRELFNGKVLQYFENTERKYSIEVNSGKIAIYKQNIKLKPKQIREYIEDANTIIKLFDEDKEYS